MSRHKPERFLRIQVAPNEPPIHREPGESHISLHAKKTWDGKNRPKRWIGQIRGLVVHTTGSGLPAKAQDRGVYHTVAAVDYYSKSHGCHYVCGWQGHKGGDLLQLANEQERANGVGYATKGTQYKNGKKTSSQTSTSASIKAGRFLKDIPSNLAKWWQERWPDYKHSQEFFAGTSANSAYAHVEMIPCVFRGTLANGKKGLVPGAKPLRKALKFTQAQHEAIAALALDIALRNGFSEEEEWWLTPRLVGHEDLTPISRCTSSGGWDPGYLRAEPYFDWDYVYEIIARNDRSLRIIRESQ